MLQGESLVEFAFYVLVHFLTLIVCMKDNCYKAIVHIIQKTRTMWEQGDLECIRALEGTERRKALQRKAVNVNARGRKAIDLTSRTKKYLMNWL